MLSRFHCKVMGCFWFLHDSFADLSNIALGKQAWQSSTLDHIYMPTADKAVDGNPVTLPTSPVLTLMKSIGRGGLWIWEQRT